MRAVRYDAYGGVDVLEVREVDAPTPAAGEVLVEVRAAGINPGESAIRRGDLAERWPSTFPSGQGSDLAGVITEVAPGVDGWSVGDEVVGWVDTRSSHADLVAVPAENLVAKPTALSWETAGAVFVAGATAWAMVRAAAPTAGETVVISGAAGGVGGLASQLAVERGARVLGVAGADNGDWLAAHGVELVDRAGDVAATIRELAPDGVDAFVDTFGGVYVDLAIALGVRPDRIDTVDYENAARVGARTEANAEGSNAHDVGEVVARLADGRLELPIARTFPLDEVRAAYALLDERRTRGKIVLLP